MKKYVLWGLAALLPALMGFGVSPAPAKAAWLRHVVCYAPLVEASTSAEAIEKVKAMNLADQPLYREWYVSQKTLPTGATQALASDAKAVFDAHPALSFDPNRQFGYVPGNRPLPKVPKGWYRVYIAQEDATPVDTYEHALSITTTYYAGYTDQGRGFTPEEWSWVHDGVFAGDPSRWIKTDIAAWKANVVSRLIPWEAIDAGAQHLPLRYTTTAPTFAVPVDIAVTDPVPIPVLTPYQSPPYPPL